MYQILAVSTSSITSRAFSDKDSDDDYQMGDKKDWKMNMLNEWKKKGNDSDLSVLMR